MGRASGLSDPAAFAVFFDEFDSSENEERRFRKKEAESEHGRHQSGQGEEGEEHTCAQGGERGLPRVLADVLLGVEESLACFVAQ